MRYMNNSDGAYRAVVVIEIDNPEAGMLARDKITRVAGPYSAPGPAGQQKKRLKAHMLSNYHRRNPVVVDEYVESSIGWVRL